MRVLLAAALFFSLAVFCGHPYGYPPLKMDGRIKQWTYIKRVDKGNKVCYASDKEKPIF